MATRADIRKQKNRLKRKKRIINTLKFLIILVAVYAIIFCTPFFKVKVNNIRIEGAKVTAAEDIKAASGIYENQHILTVNKKKAVQEINKLAYVKNSEVKRVFPNKVKILITEGKVCANLALAEGFAAIDDTGKIMEITQEVKSAPTVIGLKIKNPEIGKKITIDETVGLDVILEYIHQLNTQTLPLSYTSLNYTNGEVSVELENGIIAFFGNKNDIEYKVAAFAESLRSAGDLSKGYFDVSNPGRIMYSPLTPAEEEALKKAAEEAPEAVATESEEETEPASQE